MSYHTCSEIKHFLLNLGKNLWQQIRGTKDTDFIIKMLMEEINKYHQFLENNRVNKRILNPTKIKKINILENDFIKKIHGYAGDLYDMGYSHGHEIYEEFNIINYYMHNNEFSQDYVSLSTNSVLQKMLPYWLLDLIFDYADIKYKKTVTIEFWLKLMCGHLLTWSYISKAETKAYVRQQSCTLKIFDFNGTYIDIANNNGKYDIKTIRCGSMTYFLNRLLIFSDEYLKVLIENLEKIEKLKETKNQEFDLSNNDYNIIYPNSNMVQKHKRYTLPNDIKEHIKGEIIWFASQKDDDHISLIITDNTVELLKELNFLSTNYDTFHSGLCSGTLLYVPKLRNEDGSIER